MLKIRNWILFLTISAFLLDVSDAYARKRKRRRRRKRRSKQSVLMAGVELLDSGGPIIGILFDRKHLYDFQLGFYKDENQSIRQRYLLNYYNITPRYIVRGMGDIILDGYYGIGLKATDEGDMVLRVPLGLAYRPKRRGNFDTFFGLIPGLVISAGFSPSFSGVFGLRYFFK